MHILGIPGFLETHPGRPRRNKGVRGLGFRGLWSKVQGFGVEGLGFRFGGLGSRVLGFRVLGFRVDLRQTLQHLHQTVLRRRVLGNADGGRETHQGQASQCRDLNKENGVYGPAVLEFIEGSTP